MRINPINNSVFHHGESQSSKARIVASTSQWRFPRTFFVAFLGFLATGPLEADGSGLARKATIRSTTLAYYYTGEKKYAYTGRKRATEGVSWLWRLVSTNIPGHLNAWDTSHRTQEEQYGTRSGATCYRLFDRRSSHAYLNSCTHPIGHGTAYSHTRCQLCCFADTSQGIQPYTPRTTEQMFSTYARKTTKEGIETLVISPCPGKQGAEAPFQKTPSNNIRMFREGLINGVALQRQHSRRARTSTQLAHIPGTQRT